MAETAFRGVKVPSSTTVTVTCNHNKQNIRWVVWQISVETSVSGSEAQVNWVRRNGRFITSTFTVPSSAQGPPALSLEGSDNLEVQFGGMSDGEEAIVTLFFEEVLSGEYGSAFGLV